MALELGQAPPLAQVRQRLARHFGELFRVEIVPTPLAELEQAEGVHQAIEAR
jgi:hypothetical protein